MVCVCFGVFVTQRHDYTYIYIYNPLGNSPKGLRSDSIGTKSGPPRKKMHFSIYNQDPQEELNCTKSRPPRFSLCEILSKKRVYILHWVGWVGYRIKSPKLKQQKFKQI